MQTRSSEVGAALREVAVQTSGALLTELHALTSGEHPLTGDPTLELAGVRVVFEEADEDLGGGFTLVALTDDEGLNGVLHEAIGFAYDTPRSKAEVETRWRLQMFDEVGADQAALLAAALNRLRAAFDSPQPLLS